MCTFFVAVEMQRTLSFKLHVDTGLIYFNNLNLKNEHDFIAKIKMIKIIKGCK